MRRGTPGIRLVLGEIGAAVIVRVDALTEGDRGKHANQRQDGKTPNCLHDSSFQISSKSCCIDSGVTVGVRPRRHPRCAHHHRQERGAAAWPGPASAVRREKARHSSTALQLASGSNSVIALAVSVVVVPKSFWNSTPSWLMMNVITPELPYSAG